MTKRITTLAVGLGAAVILMIVLRMIGVAQLPWSVAIPTIVGLAIAHSTRDFLVKKSGDGPRN